MLNIIRNILEENHHNQFTDDGINANLDAWAKNKSELIAILCKHPNWDEEALAIVFDVTTSREVCFETVQELYRKLTFEVHSDFEHEFEASLRAATRTCTPLITEKRQIDDILKLTGIKCVVGEKTSKVIRKICTHYGLNAQEAGSQVARIYAKLADALNPITTKRKALLSVHPLDYLTMSDGKNWDSCHRLGTGCHKTGTLSYLNDNVSMIFYTVGSQIGAKYTRQVFCYSNGILLQSALYPNTNDEPTSTTYRNLVQGAITTCLNIPNLWTLEKDGHEVPAKCNTAHDARHYADYEYPTKNPTLSILKNFAEHTTITIGHEAYCIDCGNILSDSSSLLCDDCNGGYIMCADCGERVRNDDANYIDYEYYCQDCSRYCEYCENDVRETSIAYNMNGTEINVCYSCRMDDFIYCEACNEYHHYDNTRIINDNCQDCQQICDTCYETSDYDYCRFCDGYFDSDNMDGDLCVSCTTISEEEGDAAQ